MKFNKLTKLALALLFSLVTTTLSSCASDEYSKPVEDFRELLLDSETVVYYTEFYEESYNLPDEELLELQDFISKVPIKETDMEYDSYPAHFMELDNEYKFGLCSIHADGFNYIYDYQMKLWYLLSDPLVLRVN